MRVGLEVTGVRHSPRPDVSVWRPGLEPVFEQLKGTEGSRVFTSMDFA
jgi:hypothetical protein